MVTLLIQHGADPNAKNRFGFTPLHEAVAGKHPHVVRILLEHRADPSAIDENGVSPIDLAEESGQADVAALMREYARK